MKRLGDETDIRRARTVIENSLQTLLFLQHSTLILKVDQFLDMPYRYVFWGYWTILFGIACVLVLFYIFLITNLPALLAIVFRLKEEEGLSKNIVAVIFVLSAILTAFVGIFGPMLMNLYMYMDSNKKGSYDPRFHVIALGWLIAAGVCIRALSNWLVLSN
jgi:hypothetical protein